MTKTAPPPPLTVDQLLQRENFKSTSPAVAEGGKASLINVQKDIDTLIRTGNKGVTFNDFVSDLTATGDINAVHDAVSMMSSIGSSNWDQLKSQLSTLFQQYGGTTSDQGNSYASSFVDAVGTGRATDPVVTYQSADQAAHSGYDAHPSTNSGG